MINILFTLERIGPYHNARFNKVSECKEINLNVFENNISSERYPWEEKLNKKYKVFSLSKNKSANTKSEIKNKVIKILKQAKPDLVYISGWNENISHYLLFKEHKF